MEKTLTPADELLALRLGLERTQVAFAAELGVHPVTLCRWEHGDSLVPESILRLARFLGEGRTLPAAFVPPDAEAVGLHLAAAERCNWVEHGACTPPYWRFTAPVAPNRYLEGDTCDRHLRFVYEALITRLKKLTARQRTKGEQGDHT
jgi:transcriptional regulator with XRE-family HTH domain